MRKHSYLSFGLMLAILVMWATASVSGQAWRIRSYTMAKSIEESSGRPSMNTTRFLVSDEKAVCWFEIEVDGFGPLTLTWKWLQPEGTTYREHTMIEQIPRSGSYRFWDIISIRNSPVALKTGKWTVEVLVRTERLLQTSFMLETLPTSYSVQVKVTGFDRKFFTSIHVDGIKVGIIEGGETKDLSFKIGSAHTLVVDEFVQGGEGIRYRCSSNSISARDEMVHLFFYETEYYLKIASDYGSSKGEGWYKAGSMATFSVSTPVSGEWGTRYIFRQWTGDWTGDSTTGTALMDRPKTVKALWAVDQSQLYILVAVAATAATVVLAVVMAGKRRAKKPITEVVEAPKAPVCPECGQEMLYVERVQRHYCTNCKKYRQ
jgi:hypothetical protein